MAAIDKATLEKFHLQEAQSAFLAALDFGIPEDSVIESLFEAKIQWDLDRKTEIPEQVGGQS